MTKTELYNDVMSKKPGRSAWARGVKVYAEELVEWLFQDTYYPEELPVTWSEVEKMLLNGAGGWSEFSYGGNALVYDGDIAERLCSPSELRKRNGGEWRPNRWETWLDVQTRAIVQASGIIRRCFHNRKRV